MPKPLALPLKTYQSVVHSSCRLLDATGRMVAEVYGGGNLNVAHHRAEVIKAALEADAETERMATQAIAALKSREGEDDEEWASKMADDAMKADAEEQDD